MKKPMSISWQQASFVKKVFGIFPLALFFVFISMIYSSFSFATPGSQPDFQVKADSGKAVVTAMSVYDSLHLEEAGLNRDAFDCAQKGWAKLVSQGRIANSSVIAIVDFSQPSSQKRLYVLDMKNYKMLFNTLVAHGRNSGAEWASSFSNEPSSYKSSPGFYITGATYTGGNGYSLRLNGIEKGINDRAGDRAIVMHGADYVNPSYIKTLGYIGRSQGCPAVSRQEAGPIINTLKDGACLFIYTPGQQYVSHSQLLADSLS